MIFRILSFVIGTARKMQMYNSRSTAALSGPYSSFMRCGSSLSVYLLIFFVYICRCLTALMLLIDDSALEGVALLNDVCTRLWIRIEE
jgi:hypothetical protein